MTDTEDKWQSSVYPDKETAMKARNTNIGCFVFGGAVGAAITAIVRALLRGGNRGIE